jgi:hypothetical protein
VTATLVESWAATSYARTRLVARDGTSYLASARVPTDIQLTSGLGAEPGIPRRGMVVFEIPPDRLAGAVLRVVRGDVGGGRLAPEAVVDLGIDESTARRLLDRAPTRLARSDRSTSAEPGWMAMQGEIRGGETATTAPLAGAAGPPARSGRHRRRGRRGDLPYILGLVVLIPLTIALEYTIEARSIRPPMHEAVTVEQGADATYAGAVWRLLGARPGEPREDARIPRDAVVYYVGISITPQDRAASRRIESCRVRVVDDQERVWTSAPFGVPDFERFGNPPTGCYAPGEGFGREPIRPGRTQAMVTAFLVPKEVVPRLRIQVLVGGAEPRYLEFRPRSGR